MWLTGPIADAIVRKNGQNEIVGIATVTTPDIQNQVEELTGLGLGKYEHVIPGLFDSMTMSIKFIGIAPGVTFAEHQTVNLIINAAITGLDSETHEHVEKPMTISSKGRVKSKKLGELGKGSKPEPEIELALTYYKVEIDGTVDTEINVLNKIAIIDGVDVAAAINKLLS
ncbi:MAG: phage major tail tube protein [Fusobacteriaceae bacterium]|jgi:P2 family phage contractile tail tube protein|nr:phage major tail tube protein [Fusobacteriaceae bacterium]